MAQVLHSIPSERALRCLGKQLVLAEQGQHTVQMILMLLQCLTVDENIIKKNYDKLTGVLGENGVHEALKGASLVAVLACL